MKCFQRNSVVGFQKKHSNESIKCIKVLFNVSNPQHNYSILIGCISQKQLRSQVLSLEFN